VPADEVRGNDGQAAKEPGSFRSPVGFTLVGLSLTVAVLEMPDALE
jgi:hypothetical protein